MPPADTLDRVLSITAEEGRALRNVPNTLAVLETHFPRFPVLPGVLILESLVELASRVAGPRRRLSRAEQLRFRRYVRPGDQMELAVRVRGRSEDTVSLSGQATVDGQIVMTARRIDLTLDAGR
jgi:3-hydroxyacyl-[acyl-carrier-protein] dehydratase